MARAHNFSEDSGPLLSLRAAVILLLATLVGAVAGTLTYWDQHSIAKALLAAGVAWGGSVALFMKIFGDKPAPAPVPDDGSARLPQ